MCFEGFFPFHGNIIASYSTEYIISKHPTEFVRLCSEIYSAILVIGNIAEKFSLSCRLKDTKYV